MVARIWPVIERISAVYHGKEGREMPQMFYSLGWKEVLESYD